MVEWNTKSKRMSTGGKRGTVGRCTKKKAWRGGTAAHTKSSEGIEEERKTKSGRGKTTKVRATAVKFANVYNPSTGKITKHEIIAVKENNANRLFARSNISTKGAIIRIKEGSTEKNAVITNRPGQDGVINAILQ